VREESAIYWFYLPKRCGFLIEIRHTDFALIGIH
jgi:hypothetical protein